LDNLRVENGEFHEVMKQLNDITNQGVLVRKIFDFIKNNNEVLSEGEYFKEEITYPPMRAGVMSFMIPGTKYNINIKKTTIVVLAFLLDLSFSRGIASLALGVAGFSTQTLQSIEDKERCLMLDILMKEKKDNNDFNYYERKCIQNDIECPFRYNHNCQRTIQEIEALLTNLEKKEVIAHVSRKYKNIF